VRGPNIFSGYLNNPKQTAEVLRDGWFVTGDVGRFDADGFLFLEGRLSRFSKIGGEMVPHVLVEEHILRVCGWDAEAEQVAVVVGIPDQAKGESLVLLTSRTVELSDLRAKLLEVGLPNLWVPRAIRQIEAIPMLATGKCDLRACMNLAQELA
jgi:acyl-[acyl-carrier-protein]-phospholipid O-acyltransferase/long-chain-fatty-acid--[acyl-carrier-protein] ligase